MRRLVRMAKARWRIELDYRELKKSWGWITTRDAIGWVGIITFVWSVSLMPSCVLSRRGSEKNFWCDLAHSRGILQVLLIKLMGCCPSCVARSRSNSSCRSSFPSLAVGLVW